MPKEVRTVIFDVEHREDYEGDGSGKLVGHAAVFDAPTEIAGAFQERIDPGAFADSIKEDDIRALFNHDPNYVLGRNTAGTLLLKEDKKGLHIEVDPPETQWAKDLMTSIKRNDIDQMSFGFQVIKEEWTAGDKGEQDMRTLKKVRLFDVSPVTFPAYEGTDVAVRSHDSWQKACNRINRAKIARRTLTLREKK